MNATCPAESMLRGFRVETIRRKFVLSLQKDEVFRRCYEVNEPLFGADRAIALKRLRLSDANLESNTSAMAASFVPALG
jgi:hypothetical protein